MYSCFLPTRGEMLFIIFVCSLRVAICTLRNFGYFSPAIYLEIEFAKIKPNLSEWILKGVSLYVDTFEFLLVIRKCMQNCTNLFTGADGAETGAGNTWP